MSAATFVRLQLLKSDNVGPAPHFASSYFIWNTERDPSTSTTGSFSRSSSGSDGPPPLIDADLEDNFRVVVDGEVIVFDDVTMQVLRDFDHVVST